MADNYVLTGDRLAQMLKSQEDLYAQRQHDNLSSQMAQRQQAAEMERQQQEQQAREQQAIAQETRGREYSDQALSKWLGQTPKGSNVSVGPNGQLSVNQPDPFRPNATSTYQNEMNQRAEANKVEALSKRMQNLAPGQSAMTALEEGTSKFGPDGNKIEGGMLSNPQYQPKSIGPIANMIPQGLTGMAELLGKMPYIGKEGLGLGLPEGATEERSLMYTFADPQTIKLTGVNQTKFEQERAKLRQALQGGTDPSVAVKAFRNMKTMFDNEEAAAQAGYSEPVRNKFQQNLQQVKGGTQQQSPPAPPATMRVRLKSSGQSGTINTNEFDPSIYDKI